MGLGEFATLGEFIGGIAVLVTLIYLISPNWQASERRFGAGESPKCA